MCIIWNREGGNDCITARVGMVAVSVSVSVAAAAAVSSSLGSGVMFYGVSGEDILPVGVDVVTG